MSFVKRHLQFLIELNAGGNADATTPETFSNGSTTLNIRDGIRATASIQGVSGGNTAYGAGALIALRGMAPADMAVLSTLGFSRDRFNKNKISVFAFNDGQAESPIAVFTGGIFAARVNYNAMPDVSLQLQCSSTINIQTQTIEGTSVAGSGNVADMLKAICAACDPPLKLVNKGVTARLANHAVSGSPHDQIADICMAASVPYIIDNGMLLIWQPGTDPYNATIVIGPDTGMVGYPEYSDMGIDVTMDFNPNVKPAGRMRVIPSSAPDAPPIAGVPGTYWINYISHELSSELPGGPWFTHAQLSSTQVSLRY